MGFGTQDWHRTNQTRIQKEAVLCATTRIPMDSMILMKNSPPSYGTLTLSLTLKLFLNSALRPGLLLSDRPLPSPVP